MRVQVVLESFGFKASRSNFFNNFNNDYSSQEERLITETAQDLNAEGFDKACWRSGNHLQEPLARPRLTVDGAMITKPVLEQTTP
jgi:hypothetical protein